MLRSFSCKIVFLFNMLYTRPMSKTYNPSKRKRATTHGFLVRSKTASGKRVIKARRRKGRAKLTVKPVKKQ